MPINKLALIRYKTIDNCLRNRFRKWTLDDLLEACSDALYEYEGITRGVSRRTIQLDIQTMRSEKLGYNAPIIVTDKKFYSYDDRNYSITNIPLTSQDLGTLTEVVEVLKQFKGFSYFQDLTGMVSKLEDKIYRQQHKGRSYISFEKNDQLKGLEHIEALHKALINKRALLVAYKSFKAREADQFTFYPYMLKEYRNRWFVLGAKKKRLAHSILALDRIVSVVELPQEDYIENTEIDFDTYFDDVIGVTKNPGMKPLMVVMKIDSTNAPYILTKPMHPSQRVLKEDDEGVIFSIEVIWNFELEREILGFGESLKVLSPKRLRNKIAYRVSKMAELYHAAPVQQEEQEAGESKAGEAKKLALS